MDVPLADVYPEILRLSGQTQSAGEPTGYHLVRRDGTVLDAALPLAAQRVLDGELLALRPFADSLPPAVYDDVVDAVASAVDRDRRRWTDDLMRAAGLVAGVLMLVMMGFVLWWADPVKHEMHSLPGVIAGALMAFTLSIDDFVVTYFTAGADALTLPLKIYTMVKISVTPEVNAVSTLLMLLTLALIVVASRLAPGALRGR